MRHKGWPAWTAQVNDLVGGYIVTTYPYPAAEHDHRSEGDPLKCGYIIADCATEQDAVKIALLLNRERYVPEVQNPNKWRWVSAGYLDGSLRLVHSDG